MDTEQDIGAIRQTGKDTYACDAADPMDQCPVSAVLHYGGVEHARVTVSTPYAVADYPLHPDLSPLENAETALRNWFAARARTKEQEDERDHQDE